MGQFRFEDLQIWTDSIELTDQLLDIADKIENKKVIPLCGTTKGSFNEYFK